ncbi:MAG: hypothetical protein WC637_00260 [Victivallales bacterium]|jgi:hypothetical protein
MDKRDWLDMVPWVAIVVLAILLGALNSHFDKRVTMLERDMMFAVNERQTSPRHNPCFESVWFLAHKEEMKKNKMIKVVDSGCGYLVYEVAHP